MLVTNGGNLGHNTSAILAVANHWCIAKLKMYVPVNTLIIQLPRPAKTSDHLPEKYFSFQEFLWATWSGLKQRRSNLKLDLSKAVREACEDEDPLLPSQFMASRSYCLATELLL